MWIIYIRLNAYPVLITCIQVYAPTTDADTEEVEEYYEKPLTGTTRNIKERFPHFNGRLECQDWKRRITRNNWKMCPWKQKWSKRKTHWVLLIYLWRTLILSHQIRDFIPDHLPTENTEIKFSLYWEIEDGGTVVQTMNYFKAQ